MVGGVCIEFVCVLGLSLGFILSFVFGLSFWIFGGRIFVLCRFEGWLV